MSIDNALQQLDECLSSLGCLYEISQRDSEEENVLRLSVVKDNQEFSVYFDANKQQFCFSLENGGVKGCSTIDEFESLFGTYLDIHFTVIPRSKMIVDVFEHVISENTVFDYFAFDTDDYKVVSVFKILGQNDSLIHVVKYLSYDEYHVYLKGFNEDKTKLKTLKEYVYRLDDTNHPVLVPTISSYVDMLFSKYGDDNSFKINRYDMDKFKIEYNGSVLYCQVIFSGLEIKYRVGMSDANLIDVFIKDAFDLEDLFNTYNTVSELIEDAPVTFMQNDDVDYQSFESEALSDDVESDAVDESECVSDESEEVTSPMDFVVKLIVEDDIQVAVRFIFSDRSFDMSVSKAEELGVPISRIKDKEERKCIRGIYMTESERKTRSFAKDVNGDDVMCNRLVDKLFE